MARLLSLLPSPSRETLGRLSAVGLLVSFFYLLGLYMHSTPSLTGPATITTKATSVSGTTCVRPSSAPAAPVELNFAAHHLAPLPATSTAPIPFCARNFTDYSPCHDPNRERRFHSQTVIMYHRERHCPPDDERPRPRCRVPRPEGYRTHFPWPQSRNQAWFANVPSTRLVKAKADQNWVRVEGDRLIFPGGGTSFPHGVRTYANRLKELVPLNTGEIRTALDIGCGVASFGGHLLDYNVLTVSVAPRDVHEAQVQFALERGIPAMLGVLSLHRLPFPSRSFDMAHCARCLIQWTDHGGLYLLEIDRVLRPGGYWVLSGPPIDWKTFYKGWARTPEDLQAEQNSIEDLATRLCWEKVVEKGTIAVWRKPTNHVDCMKKSTVLPFCEAKALDSGWYKAMNTCISPLPTVQTAEETAGGVVENWPKRLTTVPPRVLSGSIEGISADTFTNDIEIWKKRLGHYEAYISFSSPKYRNIMDMNAGLGGFAASLVKYPVWVMNAVPFDLENNTLGAIYERGLIGTYMNWCEGFSTYPRTYDLIHANWIFSLYRDRCEVIDILLEMDRILRPEGAVIIRDHVDVITIVKRESDRLQWHSRIVHTEKGPFDPEKLLIVDNSLVQ